MAKEVRPLPRWCKDVRHQMIEKELKVNDLADELDISRVYLSEIIGGRRIAPDMAERISKYLGVETPYLIS
ncbi:MAG TPA: XRE family transcriptional regulator [Lachnospiraceae bacterium]|nr:XRE family transcriptional regulator [Lachnospiraceae bacterium]